MELKIRPSRRGNFDVTAARLRELGVSFAGYDHHRGCYADVVIPPGVETKIVGDPLIEVVPDDPPQPRRAGPVWASAGATDPATIAERARHLRVATGWDFATAAAQSGGRLSAEAIERLERDGVATVADLIALADLYAASLDRLAGRTVIRGSRRR